MATTFDRVNLFDAMDSISDETAECYESIFDPSTNGWNADIEGLYSGGPIGCDLLFIDRIERTKHSVGRELAERWFEK